MIDLMRRINGDICELKEKELRDCKTDKELDVIKKFLKGKIENSKRFYNSKAFGREGGSGRGQITSERHMYFGNIKRVPGRKRGNRAIRINHSKISEIITNEIREEIVYYHGRSRS
jgi:hypothetical protein|uniref:Uncharacterized protein n=1 Tax=Sipha flava TaxID=143950 RepID=A0A2S2QFR8_9HEMI